MKKIATLTVLAAASIGALTACSSTDPAPAAAPSPDAYVITHDITGQALVVNAYPVGEGDVTVRSQPEVADWNYDTDGFLPPTTDYVASYGAQMAVDNGDAVWVIDPNDGSNLIAVTPDKADLYEAGPTNILQ